MRTDTTQFWMMAALGAVLTAFGLGAAHYMELHGHVVTGMNNQIVWGLPHVFAIFMVVAASGVLNVASIGSVFGQGVYKPQRRSLPCSPRCRWRTGRQRLGRFGW